MENLAASSALIRVATGPNIDNNLLITTQDELVTMLSYSWEGCKPEALFLVNDFVVGAERMGERFLARR